MARGLAIPRKHHLTPESKTKVGTVLIFIKNDLVAEKYLKFLMNIKLNRLGEVHFFPVKN